VTEASSNLGAILRDAREQRGVDIGRVERDTRIRSRYLAALERGDYRELPGPVYTRGFLRNYAGYLGLDPEQLLDLYRIENADGVVEPAPEPIPRPMPAPQRSLVITPGALLAAVLTTLVVLFVGWLGYQFATFAQTPELVINDPAGDLPAYAGREYVIRGQTEPNARVRVDGLTQNPTVTADADGDFVIEVGLLPGSNLITLVAYDPVTGRDSDAETRTIVVAGSPSPSGVDDGVTVASPQAGAVVTSPVPLAGSASRGSSVAVTTALVAPAPLTFRVLNLAGQEVQIEPEPPPIPAPVELAVGRDGSFAGELVLPAGTWELTFAGADGEPAKTRRVTVQPGAGLAGRLEVTGGVSYLEIEEDGVPKAEVSGGIAAAGTVVDLRARRSIRIRAGNAAAVGLSLNGVMIGAMGQPGAVVEWRIERIG